MALSFLNMAILLTNFKKGVNNEFLMANHYLSWGNSMYFILCIDITHITLPNYLN